MIGSRASSASKSLEAGMAEGTEIDAFMKNKYARNPEKLRAWESARRIERAPKRERSPPR